MTVEIRELIIHTEIGNLSPPRPEVPEQDLTQLKQTLEDDCLKTIQAENAHRTDER